MKKTLNLLLILTILAFGSLKADAVELKNSEVKAMIEKQIVDCYKKETNAEIEVIVVALPFKDLSLPDGKVSLNVTTASKKFVPRDLYKVSVYVNGVGIKSFNAPTIIKAYDNVLVASKVIQRESAITKNVIKIERKEISNNFDYILREKDLNNSMVAKKYFVEGELMDKRFVKIKPDVSRNSEITAFFNNNNLTISLEATALSDGVIGDEICVISKDYNKIYKGTIIGENRVLVKI